jgi:hypothetical protein
MPKMPKKEAKSGPNWNFSIDFNTRRDLIFNLFFQGTAMNGTLFTSKNFKIFGICLALLLLGYVLLGQGPVDNPLSKTIAPIILVAVYCALIPYAILAGSKDNPGEKEPQKKKGV